MRVLASTPASRIIGPVIEAQGLIKRFGKLVAVDAVSFTCHDGEVFGLLGPNGGGHGRVSPRLRFLPNDANMSGRLVPGFPTYQFTNLPVYPRKEVTPWNG